MSEAFEPSLIMGLISLIWTCIGLFFGIKMRRPALRIKVGDINVGAESIEDAQALLKLARQFHDFSLDR